MQSGVRNVDEINISHQTNIYRMYIENRIMKKSKRQNRVTSEDTLYV